MSAPEQTPDTPRMYTSKPIAGRGVAAIIATGAMTACVVGASMVVLRVAITREVDNAALTGEATAAVIYLIVGPIAWVLLAQWMVRAGHALAARGLEPAATWKVWASWFIPFYGLVAPFNAMKNLTITMPGPRIRLALNVWWGGWIGSWAIDWLSRQLATANTIAGFVITSSIALITSYVGLAFVIVWTSRHLDAPFEVRTRPAWMFQQ